AAAQTGRGESGEGGARARRLLDHRAVVDAGPARLDQAREGTFRLAQARGEAGPRRREGGGKGGREAPGAAAAAAARRQRQRRAARHDPGQATVSSRGRTWQQVSARVRAQREYGSGYRWLDLSLPLGFTPPVAGQFVQLRLAEPSPVLLPRPMSVAQVAKRRS